MGKPNIKELEKAFEGDLDLVLFFIAWVKHGRNATKAYKELNPQVDITSAQVLGSRQLAKIDRGAVLESYGLGIQEYFAQIKEGHEAMKWNDFTGEREPDHKVRADYNKRIGLLLGLEKGGEAPSTQNNYFNLTDEQLDQLIESKRRKTGVIKTVSGKGEENIIESSEVREESR